ncbi:MAG: hypothetical protein ACJ8FY_21420 [Gemmataceae bacterium]
MYIGTSNRGQELAKRANEAEARTSARNRQLAWVLFALYCVYACELAGMIVAMGGGWWALLAPLLASFGPRYWKSIGEQVTFYAGFVVFIALMLIFASPRGSREKGKITNHQNPIHGGPSRK